MKKIISFVFIIAALVFAASCINERLSREEGDGVFTLRLQTAALETRADDAPTEEEIENTVTHADFFFFSNEAGTDLLYKTRLEVKEGELVAKSGNIYEYTFDVSSENNPLKKTSYLYVIANYPETISVETLADILALDIKTDLSGTFSSFVMDSYDSSNGKVVTKLTPSKPNDNKEVTIGLTRAAAKLVLNINVKDSYTDGAENVWTPVTEQMWVNFVNVRKTAIVEAAPVVFDAKTNYFNTAQEAPASVTPAAKTGYTSWKTSSVYTYPQSYTTDDVHAPYYKIFCPWICEKKGMNNFYYKIILPNLSSFQRNKVYNVTVDLSVIGGTEEDWALVTEYIYVADWWAPDAIEATFEGAGYLDVPVKTYYIYGIDFVTIPVVSSNPITVSGSPTNATATVTGTKQNLYGTNGNGVPTNETITPTISDITKDGFKLTHQLETNVTLQAYDFTPITYTLYVNHDQSSSGALNKPIEVTVVQYPSVYASRAQSNGYVYVNGQGGGGSQTTVYNNNGDNIGTVVARSGVDGTGTNNNQNNYNVYVSVLPDGSEDVIGDPRAAAGGINNLGYATYTSQYNYTVDNTVSTKYKAASQNAGNIIAPAFKIASSYGKTTRMSSERAKERCASYQENGYPAGRWRLPTSAEVLFVRNLSRYQHIPTLFQTNVNDGYWTADGYIYSATEYGDITTSTADTRSVRCVYDIWYWGEEPYTANATTWLGFQMD